MSRRITAHRVRERVRGLRCRAAASVDDGALHQQEDKIHVDTLEAIARGHSDPAGLARAALGTESIRFERWFE